MKKIRDRLSYANVMATLAAFIALGGTSYAVADLPRNSVGSTQLRANSVGASEIRREAVRSPEIDDRAIRLRDISQRTRDALRGQVGPPGPPGPTFFATIDSGGGRVKGNAIASASNASGTRLISFSRSVASCVPVAAPTVAAGGAVTVPPEDAHIRAENTADGRVLVRMWNGTTVASYPFNLIVAC
jgi:hypothetical protein